MTVSSSSDRTHSRTGANVSKTAAARPVPSPSIATPSAGMCETPKPAMTSAMRVPSTVAHHFDELLGAHARHRRDDVRHFETVDHAYLVDEENVPAELDHAVEVPVADGLLLLGGQPEPLHERLGVRDERVALGLLVQGDREIVQRQALPGASSVEDDRPGDCRGVR